MITGARRSGKSYLMNELYYKYLLASGVPSANVIRFAFDADEDIHYHDIGIRGNRNPWDEHIHSCIRNNLHSSSNSSSYLTDDQESWYTSC